MRHLVWIVALIGATQLVPAAHAQSSYTGSPSSSGYSGAYSSGPSSTAPAARTTMQPDPNNCGTPDEPKECGPMPRRSLQHYPANRPG
jgi:hypothetical protein